MMTHAYQRDPHSGAGNCTCGAAEHHVWHPHEFQEAWIWAQRVGEVRCVCSRSKSDLIHAGPQSCVPSTKENDR